MHIIASVLLVTLILLHAGRGGGLSERFGGGVGGGGLSGSSAVEKNLDRLTIVVALVFTVTTVALGFALR